LNTIQHKKSGVLIVLLALCLCFPAVAQYDFTASETTGYAPLKVKYTFVSSASVDTISSFYWDFGNGQTSTLESPDTVIYDTPGTYSPSLVFNNRMDLIITKSQFIEVQKTEDIISISNVFSPNDDGINDDFLVTTLDEVPLKMNIFTRAGILVFKSEGTSLTWNGYAASGQKLSAGIYFYTIEALGADPGNIYNKKGFFYMYR
jgi:gliding motility-associated-like protein